MKMDFVVGVWGEEGGKWGSGLFIYLFIFI